MNRNPTTPKILHVDDNPNVISFVGPELRAAGFNYVSAGSGAEALARIESERPDMVVLDVMLGDPALGGLDVCKKIREAGHKVPVIFLTVKDRTDESGTMRQAFSVGATDYISKREELRRIEQSMGLIPTEFLERKSDIDELITRIKAHLHEKLPTTEYDDRLQIDFETERVQVRMNGDWKDVKLSAAQFRILRTLAINEGKGVTKTALLAAAGGAQADADTDRALQSLIYRLRELIEPDPRNPTFVITYHRFGYRFGGTRTSDS
ncbi:MAG: response regulator transcription factor [Chloroflexi bacterium]|nr:response regulator transcription factor [Chloroflexota bacterium]